MTTLTQEWRDVLKKAWSVRFFALSILLQVLDIILSTLGEFSDTPVSSIAMQLLGVIFAAAGLWSRFVYQKNMDKAPP